MSCALPEDKLSQQANCSPDVDSVYQSIRNSSPEYEVQEQIVNFQNEGMNLVATMVIPVGIHKPPVVITCNGFTEDRFYLEIPNTGGEHFYVRLSRIFAERGVATLRIDYRGSGDSDGDYSMTTFSSQISDVLAAIKYVSKDLKHLVNTKKIGLFGHSQGGIVISFAAGQEKRVKSLAMWSTPSSPPINYATLIQIQGVKNGLVLPDGGTIVTPLYWGRTYLDDVKLCKGFFEELMVLNPVVAIRDYKGPLMYVAGENDDIVFPQPLAAQSFLDNHKGEKRLVLLPGGHEFNTDSGYEDFDSAVFWILAWYLATL